MPSIILDTGNKIINKTDSILLLMRLIFYRGKRNKQVKNKLIPGSDTLVCFYLKSICEYKRGQEENKISKWLFLVGGIS